MTIRLRLSDSGDAHFGSSDPRSQRTPSEQPTDDQIAAQSHNPLSVEQYSTLILSEKAKNDPAYRRELDARLASGHYHGEVRNHVAAENHANTDRVTQIMNLQPGTPREIASMAVKLGAFFNMESQIAALKAAKDSGSQNAMDVFESRVALSMLEGR